MFCCSCWLLFFGLLGLSLCISLMFLCVLLICLCGGV